MSLITNTETTPKFCIKTYQKIPEQPSHTNGRKSKIEGKCYMCWSVSDFDLVFLSKKNLKVLNICKRTFLFDQYLSIASSG